MIKKKHLLALLRNFSLTMEGISQVWAFLQILILHVFSSSGLKKIYGDKWSQVSSVPTHQVARYVAAVVCVEESDRSDPSHITQFVALRQVYHLAFALIHVNCNTTSLSDPLGSTQFVAYRLLRCISEAEQIAEHWLPPVCHLAPSWYIGYHPIWFNAPNISFHTYSSSTLS